MSKSVCVVVGVGPGNGAAFATHFLNQGYQLALLARTKEFGTELANKLGVDAHFYECDVSNEKSVQQAFDKIKNNFGRVDVVIYNAGSGKWGNVEEISPQDFESSWRVNTLGLLLVSQEVVPLMKEQKQGKIIVIGATASKRGNISTAAFAPAKAAQRSLAESMARYLGPQGIHVAVVIIDGIIDLPGTRERMPDRPDGFFIKPADVANTVFWLAQQAPSAWTFELDVRPNAEKW